MIDFDCSRTLMKPWGHEEHFGPGWDYLFKRISINAGQRTSLQRHNRKDETILVLAGTGFLIHGNDQCNLSTRRYSEGDVFHILPKTVHRIEAETATVLIEASTPEDEDVVRIEDDYDRE